jgi:hypothetical protein
LDLPSGKLERMFDGWPLVYPRRPARRVVDPPVTVVVDLRLGLPTRLADMRRVPLFVRQDGLELVEIRPGFLVGWVQSTAGEWWGLVDVDLRTGSGRGHLIVRQLLPARAITADRARGKPEAKDPAPERR